VESPLLESLKEVNPPLWDALGDVFDNLTESTELPQVWHYAALVSLIDGSASMREKMMSKWVPDSKGDALENCLEVLTRVSQSHLLSDDMRERLSKINVDDYAHLTLVWRFNSFGHHTDSNALCMYNITSMMAHSCGASGVWHFGSGDSFCLRARVALRPGDEITISYLSDEDLFKSVLVRRQKTQGWLFDCACTRCTSTTDFSRSFRCPVCVTGSILVSPENQAGPCDTCITNLSSEVLLNYLELEPIYVDRVTGMDRTDSEDVLAVLKEALNLFSDSHWIVYVLESMLSESLKGSSNPARIDLLLRRLEYLRKNFPWSNYTTSWLLEEIGDWYSSQQSRTVAASYYERAYWSLRIMCGQDHPFTESAQCKWDDMLEKSSDHSPKSYA
jgi:hypothetical protein